MNIGIDDIFYETASSLPKEAKKKRSVDISKKEYETNNQGGGACSSCWTYTHRYLHLICDTYLLQSPTKTSIISQIYSSSF